MTQKVIFLDIDGTMVGFDGIIPDSTREALRQAKARGHKLIICTGRSSFQIIEELTALEFDGIVSNAGAHAAYGGREIYHFYLEMEKRKVLLDYMKNNNFVYSAHCDDKMVVDKSGFPKVREEFQKFVLDEAIMNYLTDLMVIREDIWNEPGVEKVVFFQSPYSIARIRQDLKPDFDVMQFSYHDVFRDAGEITSAGINKATGMQAVLDHVGSTREDCIAIGDGPNDIEMIEFAGCGIAMGNAGEELKAVADYITDSIDADGIWKAFRKHGLI